MSEKKKEKEAKTPKAPLTPKKAPSGGMGVKKLRQTGF